MKVAGIAQDLTFDVLKQGGYNFIGPVLEDDGNYYVLFHKAEEINALIEMTEEIDEHLRDDWLKGFLKLQDQEGKDIGSIYKHEYVLVPYEPDLCGENMLREVDETFHIQPDMDFSGAKMILGFTLDNDVFIGNSGFIIGQIELFIDKPQTAEEFDILYHIYSMTEQFVKMGKVIKDALQANLSIGESIKWTALAESYKVSMQVEYAIKNFKDEKKRKNVSLTKEM